MRRHLVLFFAATVAVAAAACGSDSTPSLAPTDANVVGSFSLTTAAGHTLPYVAIQDGTNNWSVSSAKLVLLADKTWVDTISYTLIAVADGSITTQIDPGSGVYQISNGTINFVQTSPVSGASFLGSVSGNTLTILNADNQLYVYTK